VTLHQGMRGRVLEYLLNFKAASWIQISPTSNPVNSRINDVHFPVALDSTVEWLGYLTMQEGLQLLLLMGTEFRHHLDHVDSLMHKNLWRQIAAFPKLLVRFSTFYQATCFHEPCKNLSLKPLHFYPIWLRLTSKFKSKVKVGTGSNVQ